MGIQVLAAVGRAQLRVIGLNPQRLVTESEARFPGAPTWRGMDYQPTGLGERRFAIEARTAPHIFGGLDALDLLRAYHEAQSPQSYIRLGRSFAARRVGLVVIRNLAVTETHLHPADGMGRIVDVELDLIQVGDV